MVTRLIRSAAKRVAWLLSSGFVGDRRGTIAVFVAAAAIPLIGALGLATDAARGYLVKSRLHQAIDAAALAGGTDIESLARDADIQKFFAANFPSGYMDATLSPLTITPSANNTTLTVSATATVPTTFMRVLGFDTVTVAAQTEVTRTIAALDVVLAMDVSGSMGSPSSKIQAARDAATELVDFLFAGNLVSPTTTAGGIVYNVLNVGLVPWNHAVNVARNGEAFTTATEQGVAPFVNPITGQVQSTVWYANNSPVPLLFDPRSYDPVNQPALKDSTWSGQVYARYIDDGDNDNDGDLVLDAATVGSVEWMAFEPAPDRAAIPRSGNWPSGSGNWCSGEWWCGWFGLGAWQGYERQCYSVYWQFGGLTDSTRPTEVPNRAPYIPGVSPTTNTHDQDQNNSRECDSPPNQGITALTPVKSTVTTAIGQLTPSGRTGIANGLYWAWEVLMPGGPYAEAAADPPFPRAQAIVLMTDGQNVGYYGDAYKMVFGEGDGAGTTTTHGTMPAPAPGGTYNNLDGRLVAIAAAIKEQGVSIYVIKYQYDNPATETLLKLVASGPDAPYYYNAGDAGELQDAFEAIAADLSRLRLSK